MKLVTFAGELGPEIGVVDGRDVIPLRSGAAGWPLTMVDLVVAWDRVRGEVEAMVARRDQIMPLADTRLLAPIRRPGKIMAMGLNYADHVAETRQETPQHQVWFCKQANTVHPPFEPIQIPRVSSAVDYEVELVFVVGRAGRHISREQAPRHVFGYCVGNDVSVRDWQRRTPQWVLGKSFDTHGPFGPWITTADEIGDPHRLDIRAFVNGGMRQDSNTRHLIYDVFDQIALLSQAMTLEPGDIVFTGTPGGVGGARKPPVFLKAGDRVRCEIAELGAIEAVFETEP